MLDYLNNTNKNKNHKKFDFSVLPGPHFSSDTGLGLGIIGMGLYRQERRDTISQPSNVSIFGDITTKSSYTVGIFGTHVFPYDKGRIDYEIAANYFKEKFWGIGYEMGNNDANEGLMKRWKIGAKANFLWEVARNVFIGPSLTYDFADILEIDRPEPAGRTRQARVEHRRGLLAGIRLARHHDTPHARSLPERHSACSVPSSWAAATHTLLPTSASTHTPGCGKGPSSAATFAAR